MSAHHSKITPALFPILVAALLSACSDSTGPSADQATGTDSPAVAAPFSPPTGSTDGVASTEPGAPKLSFAIRTTTWAAPDASVGQVQIKPGAASCSGTPRYVQVGGISATVLGSVQAAPPPTQLVTADVDLYRWNGTAWAYHRTLRSAIQLGGSVSAKSFGAVKFGLSAAGYYHVMVRVTWWANPETGSWVKKASAVYALNSLRDYSTGGTPGTVAYAGYCRII